MRFGTGCKGHVVEAIQRQIKIRGYTPQPGFLARSLGGLFPLLETARSVVVVDGDYGKKTASAVAEFQRQKMPHVSPNGCVDEETWSVLFEENRPFPSPFDRCLQVTASFEGTQWGGCVGDFDGAILTYGILGFTAVNGELSALVKEAISKAPELADLAPGGVREVAKILSTGAEGWKGCLDSKNKSKVRPEWKQTFATWGESPAMRDSQRARAQEVYWKRAEDDRKSLGLPQHVNVFGLLFDVAVQNGGIKKATKTRFSEWKSGGQRTVKAAIEFLAEEAAKTARPRFYADVKSRKSCFLGSGKVHGKLYDLREWGFEGR